MFNIQKVKLAIKPVDEMIKSDVKFVEVCYLCLNAGVYTSDLLSELYYRNKEGIAYADSEVNKIAPRPQMHTVTNVKIKDVQIQGTSLTDTRIINSYVL
mgnify:CR=1 FL=1